MRRLRVKRFLQEPGYCAIASVASIGNFYNKNINYDITKKISRLKICNNLKLGLDSGEIGTLLNLIGFQSVTLVSTNLYIFDYTWIKLGKKKFIQKLEEAKDKICEDYRESANSIYKWLKTGYNNKVILDYNFSKYIKKFLNKGKPVLVSFNWTMFFKYSKKRGNIEDSIKGEYEEHVAVIYGYNKTGVYVCDSHHEYYKYKLKKYRKGFYHISWENLMSIVGLGDIFLPMKYRKINLEKF